MSKSLNSRNSRHWRVYPFRVAIVIESALGTSSLRSRMNSACNTIGRDVLKLDAWCEIGPGAFSWRRTYVQFLIFVQDSMNLEIVQS